MVLVGPVARMVIKPPGPGAAFSISESNCEELSIWIATPVAALLCKAIFPPLALERRLAVPAGSLDETWIRELMIETASCVEERLTMPPAPLGGLFTSMMPVVALIVVFWTD